MINKNKIGLGEKKTMSESSANEEYFRVDDPDECASFLNWIIRVGEDQANMEFIDELFITLQKIRKDGAGGKKDGSGVCRWERSVRKLFDGLSSNHEFSLTTLGAFLRRKKLPSSLVDLTDQTRARLISFLSGQADELRSLHVLQNFYYIQIALLSEADRVPFFWSSSKKLKRGFARLSILIQKWGKGIVFGDCVLNIWALGFLKETVFDTLVFEFSARVLSRKRHITFYQLEEFLQNKLG